MSENVQKISCDISHLGGRVETGAVQFNEDWPGLFVRGDNAAYLSLCWSRIKDLLPEDVQNQCLMEIFQLDDMFGASGTVQGDVIV